MPSRLTECCRRNTADSTRSDKVAVKAFLLQGIVLGKTSLVDKVHRLLHRIFYVLVIRRQGEEQMVEGFNIGFCFNGIGNFHIGLMDEYWQVAVQNVDVLVRVGNLATSDDKAEKCSRQHSTLLIPCLR